MFLKPNHVLNDFCRSIITPQVKHETGYLTDMSNYRTIAVSNAITKMLEDVILSLQRPLTQLTDEYQFGFYKGHSTGSCTYVFKMLLIIRPHCSITYVDAVYC